MEEINNLAMKAFFLGSLCADRPLTFEKAFKEFLDDEPITDELQKEALLIWPKDLKKELKSLWDIHEVGMKWAHIAYTQLDAFLTALSLSQIKNEEKMDLMEEMEDLLDELDEVMSTNNAFEVEELKRNLLELWNEWCRIIS